MRVIKATYDKVADASYMYLNKGKVHKTLRLKYPIIVDIDKKGKILGVEMLNVSKISNTK